MAARVLTATVAGCVAITHGFLYLTFEAVREHARTGAPVSLSGTAILAMVCGVLGLALIYPRWALRRRQTI